MDPAILVIINLILLALATLVMWIPYDDESKQKPTKKVKQKRTHRDAVSHR